MSGDGKLIPFEPRNETALKHGATSKRKVAPIAAEIQATILQEAPWCNQEAFAGSVRSLAWTEAQIILVSRYLNANGLLRPAGVDELEPQPRAAVTLLRDLENRALKLRNALGLTRSRCRRCCSRCGVLSTKPMTASPR